MKVTTKFEIKFNECVLLWTFNYLLNTVSEGLNQSCYSGDLECVEYQHVSKVCYRTLELTITSTFPCLILSMITKHSIKKSPQLILLNNIRRHRLLFPMMTKILNVSSFLILIVTLYNKNVCLIFLPILTIIEKTFK